MTTSVSMQVSWSHATNSQAELASAMADTVMMIEADVSLGKNNIILNVER